MKAHRGNFQRNTNYNGKSRTSYSKKPAPRYANPQQLLQKSKLAREKYLNMAREALASGDRVEAENYFQHADHHTRVINMLNKERAIAEDSYAVTSETTDESAAPQASADPQSAYAEETAF